MSGTLRDRISLLEEENRQLRAALVPAITLPAIWRLSPLESQLVRTLYRANGSCVSYDDILLSLYGFDCETSVTQLTVLVTRVRAKEPRHGLTIQTRHRRGYALCPESCVRIRSMARFDDDLGEEAA